MSVSLSVEDVHVQFKNTTIIDGLSLTIENDDFVSIVGTSGCGKTTFLRAIGGLLPRQSRIGDARLHGVPLRSPEPRVAMVFQHFGLFPWKSVEQNIRYGLEVQGRTDGQDRIDSLLDEPLSAVDAITREIMQKEVIELIEAERRTAVLVTHDLDEAIILSDRIIVLGGPPAHVVLDVRSPIERPRTLENVRSNPDYLPLRNELWQALELGRNK